MSVSKWAYTSECNFQPCVGDCDSCPFAAERARAEELKRRIDEVDKQINEARSWKRVNDLKKHRKRLVYEIRQTEGFERYAN